MPFVTSGTVVIRAIFCRTWGKAPSYVFRRAPSAHPKPLLCDFRRELQVFAPLKQELRP